VGNVENAEQKLHVPHRCCHAIALSPDRMRTPVKLL
jgi:hypothetical protein